MREMVESGVLSPKSEPVDWPENQSGLPGRQDDVDMGFAPPERKSRAPL